MFAGGLLENRFPAIDLKQQVFPADIGHHDDGRQVRETPAVACP
jgi:hypothetical protein